MPPQVQEGERRRCRDRVDDTEAAANAYQALLDDAASTETDLQEYIEAHPWLVGLEYVPVRPRAESPAEVSTSSSNGSVARTTSSS